MSDQDYFQIDKADHINAIEEWRTNQNIENAIELCSSAIVQGDFADAKEAAALILDIRPSSQSVIEVAKKIINPESVIQGKIVDNPRIVIAIIRKKTHQSPSNAISWVDLAFAYASLSHNEKAERSMNIALMLAPHNRFVVRSAVRFFIHIRKERKAKYIVGNYRFLKQDPWVLAVEISISAQYGKPSKYLKLSRNTIERNRVSPFHSSELASALGSVEISHGANKKAVKLFKHSLKQPTDNSIAQAQWSKNEHKLAIPLDQDTIDNDSVHEAEFYQLRASGEWANSMRAAKKWAECEPFSTAAYIYRSDVALVCQNDNEIAIESGKSGLKLHKDSFALLNNSAVAYAQDGNIEKAEEKIAHVKKQNLSDDEKYVFTATNGMLAFKKNEIYEGRELYCEAIRQITDKKGGDMRSKNLANLFWVREEIIAQTDIAPKFFAEIQGKMKNEKSKDILAFKEHIKKLLHNK